MASFPIRVRLNDPAAAGNVTKTKVHELTIRYDDHSLAGRVLDFLAKQQGLARADYAKQISDALPFLLIALNNPGFQEQVAAAVSSFLQDPKSLTIEIAPDVAGFGRRSYCARARPTRAKSRTR